MRLLSAILLLTGASLIAAAPAKPEESDDLQVPTIQEDGVEVRPQIIGGTPVPQGELPFAVYVSNSRGSCTGSIIKENVVVTAAHCVGSGMSITYGNVVARSGTRVTVSRAIPHERYNPNQLTNDIAVLILSQPIRFGPNAQAIPIASSPPAPGSRVWAAGWGVTSDPNGRPPAQLMKVDVVVGNDQVCRRQNPNWGGQSGSQICLAPTRGKGVCYGDSGGPLYTGSNGSYQLLGATSWGAPGYCADGQNIAYFTRVGYYSDWIRSKIGGL
ncbi:uncharacterized protein VTP21DRAFT_10640 [Calcarisporiella thermophila]|uniref:uncharacterized protein n=1 Tax=Calcarisporiella thermophila TaxID=911321 RepID=UPI0037422A76